MSDRRTYRKFTAEQKLEIVLAGLHSGNVAEAYRSHQNLLFALLRLAGPCLEAGRSKLDGTILWAEGLGPALGRRSLFLPVQDQCAPQGGSRRCLLRTDWLA